MIQMKHYKGGIVDVPDDPPMIGRLMQNGFRQASDLANAVVCRMTAPDGNTVEVVATGDAISEAIGAGHRVIGLVMEDQHAG